MNKGRGRKDGDVDVEPAETRGIQRRRGRRVAVWVLGILIPAVGLWVLDRKTTPMMQGGPMVQMVTPEGFTVVWEARPHRPGEMEVEPGDGRRIRIPVVRNEVGYLATVSGLPVSSEVRYGLVHRSVPGFRHSISQAVTRTAKRENEQFRMLVFGDSGSGGNSQRSLALLMGTYKADLLLHVGDLVYPSGHPRDYLNNFYLPNAELIRSIPFCPVLGNHDVVTDNGRPLLDRFVLPANGPPNVEPERCFTLEYADAFIAGLDSDLTQEVLTRQVAPWLEEALQKTKRRWKFAYFHHPPYTASRHAPDERMRKVIVPVLERGGVDIAFTGHNHLYERTAPILHDAVVSEGGVTYVVSGAGGASKYPETPGSADYIRSYNDSVFSFTVVDVGPDSVLLRQVSERNETIDELRLDRK